jgi:hypothetical protein
MTKKAKAETVRLETERHEQRMLARQPVEVVGARQPHEPTELERDLHNLVHTPSADWCESCILGQAPEKRHDTVTFEMYPMIPRVQIDFGFTKAAGEVSVDDDFSTTVIAVDRDTELACAFVTGTKGCGAYAVRGLTNFVDRLHQAGRVEL